MNKVLELLISVAAVAFGVIAFMAIMTPIESSILYGLGDFLRFSIFVTALFLSMFFIVNPLFNMLKVKRP